MSAPRLRVLVVDDHFLFAQALATTIKVLDEHELAGIAVTGPQALAFTQELQPDVILLDYHIPGYEAAHLIPRLLEAAPHARVVIVTSDTSEAARAGGLAAGAVGFITKDQAIDDVVDALRLAAAATGPLPVVVDPTPASVAEPSPVPEDPGVLVRLPGVTTFAGFAVAERRLERLTAVLAVHASDITDAGTILRVDLRAGASPATLASEAAEHGLALEAMG